MTLRFDLSLEAMLQLADWNEQAHNDYGQTTILSVEEYELPFSFSYSVRLTDNERVVHTAGRFQDYHSRFIRKHFPQGDPSISNRKLIQFYSESLTNIFVHSGKKARTKPTTIQMNQPADPSRFVLRIYNPQAEKWDVGTLISKGRGGFETFSRDYAIVSYAEKGREFIAMITIPF